MGILNLLFPPRCALCGKSLPVRGKHDTPCAECLRSLPVLHEPAGCEVAGAVCLAPFRYGKPVRDGLHALKFGRRTAGVGFLAHAMVSCLERRHLMDFDTVTWVPVSPARERRRGYDQSELLARAISKAIKSKPRKLIFKSRHTVPNSTLKTNSERHENVSGAFSLAPFAEIRGKILLVDDIITTGSTVGECAALLLNAGADAVVVLAAARAR